MNWRPVRFTRHYALGLVGGIGFGLFLGLSPLDGMTWADTSSRKLVGWVGLMAAFVT